MWLNAIIFLVVNFLWKWDYGFVIKEAAAATAATAANAVAAAAAAAAVVTNVTVFQKSFCRSSCASSDSLPPKHIVFASRVEGENQNQQSSGPS